MSSIIHHLAALGWIWVSLFAALDLAAFGSAAVAVAARKRRIALWALLVAACATLASLVLTVASTTVGIASANVAIGAIDPADKARVLAGGISATMNGAAVGVVATFVAGAAAVVCLVAALIHRSAPSGNSSLSSELGPT